MDNNKDRKILHNISNNLKHVPISESLEELYDEYQLFETIGEGGFGKVLKGIQKADNKKVAIKFIAQNKITNWFYDKRLKRNIPLEIALLCHCRLVKGVITIYKYYYIEDHKGWYIVMERFNDYIDMFDHITNVDQINEMDAICYMKQLIRIIIDCHKIGVCHRDIKDENIIINRATNELSLIDFGAGGLLHDGYYNEFDGTRVYSPPEWIMHKRYKVLALETWSLGVLLYDMVCGNLPFDNDESICKSTLTFRRPISRYCQHLISLCLTKEPNNRISLFDITSHRWFYQYSTLFYQHRISEHNSPSTNFCGCIDISDDQNQNNIKSEEIGDGDCDDDNDDDDYVRDVDDMISDRYSTMFTNGIDNNNNNTRRISIDTSPFTTPQSSGLNDNDSTCNNNNNDNNNNNITTCNVHYILSSSSVSTSPLSSASTLSTSSPSLSSSSTSSTLPPSSVSSPPTSCISNNSSSLSKKYFPINHSTTTTTSTNFNISPQSCLTVTIDSCIGLNHHGQQARKSKQKYHQHNHNHNHNHNNGNNIFSPLLTNSIVNTHLPLPIICCNIDD